MTSRTYGTSRTYEAPRRPPADLAAERADPHCIAPDTAAELLRDRPWQRLAVLGDSVTAGVLDPLPGYLDRSFADRFTDALAATRPGFAAVNLAVPYLLLDEIRDRQLGPALEFAPDVVLVSAGGNDAFRAFDPVALRSGLASLLAPLAGTGALVVTIGLFDLARSGLVPPEHAEGMARRFDELDRITAALTRELGGVHVDTHHHPLSADPAIYAEDRVHANARGHAAAFAAIATTLGRAAGDGARPA
ncbi:SGNH/GDSL hydrolase family protein [Streptomyces xanthii]|uniref:SGNH/GDSL hydrolase family protein n=1 Tax=Streptomyces xanthii TaxID=2768069 RepID=A0A7H1B2M9_9ACTN|nr:SGNH/GDSL hydrolase family protein [Streptomyces xanthii]QNS02984.1 SGNH/GDSL hydrolase family protein [Streptomyces xanthii]